MPKAAAIVFVVVRGGGGGGGISKNEWVGAPPDPKIKQTHKKTRERHPALMSP